MRFVTVGVLAMEALHRQVLPFLLRRMKEDVLQDLPPKIIQDYYCNLSPLQVHGGLPDQTFLTSYSCLHVLQWDNGDHPCNNLMSYLQVQLYEDFAKSRAKATVDDSISTASAEEEEKPKLKATGHVFQVQNVFSDDIFKQKHST